MATQTLDDLAEARADYLADVEARAGSAVRAATLKRYQGLLELGWFARRNWHGPDTMIDYYSRRYGITVSAEPCERLFPKRQHREHQPKLYGLSQFNAFKSLK